MRKTESKMNDLSVTGKIVSSGYKTRNQQSKTSNQPVRPQRRYSGVHKVNDRNLGLCPHLKTSWNHNIL